MCIRPERRRCRRQAGVGKDYSYADCARHLSIAASMEALSVDVRYSSGDVVRHRLTSEKRRLWSNWPPGHMYSTRKLHRTIRRMESLQGWSNASSSSPLSLSSSSSSPSQLSSSASSTSSAVPYDMQLKEQISYVTAAFSRASQYTIRHGELVRCVRSAMLNLPKFCGWAARSMRHEAMRHHSRGYMSSAGPAAPNYPCPTHPLYVLHAVYARHASHAL